jgi:heat shock gene repressor HrcA
MISERQEKILHSLVREYIDRAEPISSQLLNKKCRLDVSEATIRNDLQALTEQGYINQPHTSAGRVPTHKAYKHFIDGLFTENTTEFPDFITKEIQVAQQNIENELKLAQELINSLQEISTTLSYTRIENKDTIFEMLKVIGPSQSTYRKNIDIITKLLKELENF